MNSYSMASSLLDLAALLYRENTLCNILFSIISHLPDPKQPAFCGRFPPTPLGLNEVFPSRGPRQRQRGGWLRPPLPAPLRLRLVSSGTLCLLRRPLGDGSQPRWGDGGGVRGSLRAPGGRATALQGRGAGVGRESKSVGVYFHCRGSVWSLYLTSVCKLFRGETKIADLIKPLNEELLFSNRIPPVICGLLN